MQKNADGVGKNLKRSAESAYRPKLLHFHTTNPPLTPTCKIPPPIFTPKSPHLFNPPLKKSPFLALPTTINPLKRNHFSQNTLYRYYRSFFAFFIHCKLTLLYVPIGLFWSFQKNNKGGQHMPPTQFHLFCTILSV